MFLILKVSSKNKNSCKKFLKFLLGKTKKLNIFPVYINYLKNYPNTKKVFTVLKSPHVNKTAQEQFEIRKYEKYIELYSYSNIFLFFIIKRISKMLCKDVRIEIGINFNNLKFLKFLKVNLNSNSKFLVKQKPNYIEGYLKALDSYGEICFIKRLDSSVG